MTKRENIVINAFINCIESGEFTKEYAIVIIEDRQRYGWLSETAKEHFYERLGLKGEKIPAITKEEPEYFESVNE